MLAGIDLALAAGTLAAMGAIRPPRPVNLFCGLISDDPDLMARAIKLLSEHVGPADAISPLWPFDLTDYYTAEMGEDLQRQFASFTQLIDPGRLASLKLLTNDLERRIAYELALPETQRLINLDPGYLSLSKIVLATTKDYSHRLYIGSGIYAESTLHYEHGGWVAWPWTYPDYADTRYHAFFTELRERYRLKLNQLGGEDRTRSDRSGGRHKEAQR